MKNFTKLILIPVIAYIVYSLIMFYFGKIMHFLNFYTHFPLLSYFLTYVLTVIPLMISFYIISRKNIVYGFGLNLKGIKNGILLSSFFTLPMILYGVYFNSLNTDIDLSNLLAKSFLAGLFEEIIYRAFIFGILFRYIKLGFIPSVAIASFVFALGHLYQGKEMFDLLRIFLLTFLGSVLYAWLYAEWNFNLWIPILLHSFMNLIWMLLILITQ
ncbi:MAG: CPBP family intramembrane metalloprotease [Chryseobacterium sp.]|uniref:CPBP family intramembrane glutamic endopeptidase n=1 Tax=Chryseobacterium sp. TaxID=1871047 RepID=UPI0028375ADE|nr:type II CAAX endopeptidase family protein [Chryseobacterium sp.]MDR2235181.1 CPBP family intramembrane metalloprotease [Chryseobacterium sp.]